MPSTSSDKFQNDRNMNVPNSPLHPTSAGPVHRAVASVRRSSRKPKPINSEVRTTNPVNPSQQQRRTSARNCGNRCKIPVVDSDSDSESSDAEDLQSSDVDLDDDCEEDTPPAKRSKQVRSKPAAAYADAR